MIVTALTNQETGIPEAIRRYAWEQREDGSLPLTVGKRYVVSGIQKNKGYTFYLIINDANELSGRPWWYPSALFRVVDSSKPADWVETNDCISFRELAEDASGRFENDLQDGEPAALSIFLKHYEQYARAHDLWYVDGKPGK